MEKSRKNCDIQFTDPETAIRNGSKWYKAKVQNPETGEETENPRPVFIVEKKDGGISVFPQYLYKFFKLSQRCVILRNGAFDAEYRYIYKNGVYTHISNSDMKKILMDYVEKYQIRLLKSSDIKEAMEFADNASEHLMHDVMNADEDIINFQNGILHLPTLKLLSHSPEIMSSIQIPCNWLEHPENTPVFDNYLHTLTCGDKGKERLILEYMGAIFSNVQGWRFKQCMFLLGKGDSGKSVLIRLIREIVGKKHCAERTLKALHDRFGLTAAYNNRLIFSSDLPFMKVDENHILKKLTGGDAVAIERKTHDFFDFVFLGLLLFGGNELTRFGGDKGKHVYDRIMIVKCDNEIPLHKRDSKLDEKLFAERGGIVYKCVNALLTAIANGYTFSEPPSCEKLRRDYMRENSAVVEFWLECVEQREYRDSVRTTAKKMYEAFRNWNAEQGNRFTPSLKEFQVEVCNWLGKEWNCIVKPTNGGRSYVDWKLNDEGKGYTTNGKG